MIKLLHSTIASAAALTLTLTPLSSSLAGPQIGVGPAWVIGSDDSTIGLDAEIGFASRSPGLDAFFGLNVLFAGLDTDILRGNIDSSADVDYFVTQAVFRLSFPVTPDRSLRLYGEGGAGATRIDANLDDLGSVDDWNFSWSLGAGVDYSFNSVVGLRAGYHYHFFDPLTIGGTNISESGLGVVKAGIVIRF
jgi:opacity protein-like surface antigen